MHRANYSGPGDTWLGTEFAASRGVECRILSLTMGRAQRLNGGTRDCVHRERARERTIFASAMQAARRKSAKGQNEIGGSGPSESRTGGSRHAAGRAETEIDTLYAWNRSLGAARAHEAERSAAGGRDPSSQQIHRGSRGGHPGRRDGKSEGACVGAGSVPWSRWR